MQPAEMVKVASAGSGAARPGRGLASRAQTPGTWLPAWAGPDPVRNVRAAGCGSNTCSAGTGRPVPRNSRRPPLLRLLALEGRRGGLQKKPAVRFLPSAPGHPRNNGLSDRSTLCQSTLAPAPLQPAYIALVVLLPASDKILFWDWLIASPPAYALCVRSSRLVSLVAKLRTRLYHWKPGARPSPAR